MPSYCLNDLPDLLLIILVSFGLDCFRLIPLQPQFSLHVLHSLLIGLFSIVLLCASHTSVLLPVRNLIFSLCLIQILPNFQILGYILLLWCLPGPLQLKISLFPFSEILYCSEYHDFNAGTLSFTISSYPILNYTLCSLRTEDASYDKLSFIPC